MCGLDPSAGKQRDVWIVLRQTEDWEAPGLGFAASAARLEQLLKYAPGTIEHIIAAWDRLLPVSYFDFRAQVVRIAAENWQRTGLCVLQSPLALDSIDPDALYVFTDDDDWFAPHLASALGAADLPADGLAWLSGRYDGHFAVRTPAAHCYTNNVALRGAALRRLQEAGAAISQHFEASALIAEERLRLTAIPLALSVTHKHPASIGQLQWAWELGRENGFAAILEVLAGRAASAPRALPSDWLWACPEIEAARAALRRLNLGASLRGAAAPVARPSPDDPDPVQGL